MTTARTSTPALARTSRVTRLVAIGFALGALEHFAGAVLLLFDVAIFPPPYAGWRHAAMAAADGAIVWIALKRSRLLIPVLAIFLAEQLMVNGPFAWREAAAGRFEWGAMATLGFVAAALVALGIQRDRTDA